MTLQLFYNLWSANRRRQSYREVLHSWDHTARPIHSCSQPSLRYFAGDKHHPKEDRSQHYWALSGLPFQGGPRPLLRILVRSGMPLQSLEAQQHFWTCSSPEHGQRRIWLLSYFFSEVAHALCQHRKGVAYHF